MATLGAAGDGVARDQDGRPVFVPFALPGERWLVRLVRRVEGGWLAEPERRLDTTDAPARAAPPCPHFGACGGCRLQHLPAARYAALKEARIRTALAQRGLAEVPVEPMRTAPLRSRRRLRLALLGNGGRIRLGFRARGSRTVVPIAVCPIAAPELEALLAPLATELGRSLAIPLPEELSLTLTTTGVDALLHAARPPSLAEREALAALATRLDLARIAWASLPDGPVEPIASRREPMVRLGGVPVAVPPGAFLQATLHAEAELAAAVLAWAPGATRVADLYAGLGTLGLPLAAAGAALHAVDLAAPSLAALRRAAATTGLGRVTVETRDLARRPLAVEDLAPYDLVLLDPPRAGALAQAEALATSRVAALIYAACDPGSFARDARILADGGYRLLTVRPLDQFLFAPEIELVAHFRREP